MYPYGGHHSTDAEKEVFSLIENLGGKGTAEGFLITAELDGAANFSNSLLAILQE